MRRGGAQSLATPGISVGRLKRQTGSPRPDGPHGEDQREKGSSVIDFPFVLVFFFLLLWGIFNFGFIFVIQSMMTTAAEDGARAALRYQPATSKYVATNLRANAAQQTAQQVAGVLNGLAGGSITTTVKSKPCSYNPRHLTCFSVQVTFPYGQHPIIPALVNFPFIGSVGIPQQLTGTAVMQVDNDNLRQD
nr:TadE/TadG family type IV pilus assembly protein [Acidithiobacillus montserratensis]